jgi:hypothetical protein
MRQTSELCNCPKPHSLLLLHLLLHLLHHQKLQKNRGKNQKTQNSESKMEVRRN